MILGTKQRTTMNQRELISAQEAFNIWDVLKSKYDALEIGGLYERMAHDPDLKYIIKVLNSRLKKHKEDLEKLSQAHLNSRYDNMWQTKMYREIVHDADFKIMLDRGLAILKKDINTLEKECENFGLTMPKKPAEVVIASPLSQESYGDDKVYRLIIGGHQGAMSLHGEAVKQCLVNDRIRVLFTDLLKHEIDCYNTFLKYGKTKEWLNPEPKYGPFAKS